MSWQLVWRNSAGNNTHHTFNSCGARYVIQMVLALDVDHLFLLSRGQVLVHIEFGIYNVRHQVLEGWMQVAEGLMQIYSQELRDGRSSS